MLPQLEWLAGAHEGSAGRITINERLVSWIEAQGNGPTIHRENGTCKVDCHELCAWVKASGSSTAEEPKTKAKPKRTRTAKAKAPQPQDELAESTSEIDASYPPRE
jgi:hypothetical protein